MPRNRTIMVRVTQNQYERILNNAEVNGHKTISDYIRSTLLGNGHNTETKINSIFEVLIGKENGANNHIAQRTLKEFIRV